MAWPDVRMGLEDGRGACFETFHEGEVATRGAEIDSLFASCVRASIYPNLLRIPV